MWQRTKRIRYKCTYAIARRIQKREIFREYIPLARRVKKKLTSIFQHRWLYMPYSRSEYIIVEVYKNPTFHRPFIIYSKYPVPVDHFGILRQNECGDQIEMAPEGGEMEVNVGEIFGIE